MNSCVEMLEDKGALYGRVTAPFSIAQTDCFIFLGNWFG